MTTSDHYRDLLDGLDIALCEYGPDLRAVRWNRTFLSFFPEHAGQIYPGEHYADNLRRFYRLRLEGEELDHIERQIAEGVERHLRQTAPFNFTHRARLLRAFSQPTAEGGRTRIWREIEPRQAERSGIPAFDLLEHIAGGACVLGADGRIIAANNELRKLYDIDPAEVIVGKTVDEIVSACWGQADARMAEVRAFVRNAMRYDEAPFEVELPGDRWRRIVTKHSTGDHTYLLHTDHTALRRQQRDLESARSELSAKNAELETLATRDPLTSLLNRRAFTRELARIDDGSALLAIDIDHFKAVNDRHGHLAGDRCLKAVAEAVRSVADAAGGVAARMGGEEFMILLRTTRGGLARIVAENLRGTVERIEGEAPLTVSIGVGIGSANPDHLAAAADEALYAAKRAGRNRVALLDCCLADPQLRRVGDS